MIHGGEVSEFAGFKYKVSETTEILNLCLASHVGAEVEPDSKNILNGLNGVV